MTRMSAYYVRKNTQLLQLVGMMAQKLPPEMKHGEKKTPNEKTELKKKNF